MGAGEGAVVSWRDAAELAAAAVEDLRRRGHTALAVTLTIPPAAAVPMCDCPDDRAMAVLQRLLSPAQREQLDRHGEFEVRGTAGGRYVVGRGGVVGTPTGWASAQPAPVCFCIAAMDPAGFPLPPADQMLIHKLALETDEYDWLSTANVFGFAYGRRWPTDHYR
jgi:hypothetical protein